MLVDHIAVLFMEMSKQSSSSVSFFPEDTPVALKNQFGVVVPQSLAEAALEHLVTINAATKLESPLTGPLYQLHPNRFLQLYDETAEPDENTSGQYDVRWEAAQANQVTRSYHFGGDVWLEKMINALKGRDLFADEAAQSLTDEMQFAPASDRIVRIDHNSAEINELTDNLDELAELVRIDNSPVIADPGDRPRIVQQIKSAVALLKFDRVSISAIKGLLLSVLTYLTVKFADEAIGQIASAAINLIKAVFGLVF
jgi:hypothetical protein